MTYSGVRAHCLWAGELYHGQHESFDSVNFQGVTSSGISTAK